MELYSWTSSTFFVGWTGKLRHVERKDMLVGFQEWRQTRLRSVSYLQPRASARRPYSLQNAVKLGRPSTRLRNVGSTRWRIMECIRAKVFFLTFQCVQPTWDCNLLMFQPLD